MARIIKVFTDKAAAMRFCDEDMRPYGGARIKARTFDGAQVFQVVAADTVKRLYFDDIFQKRGKK